MKYTKHTPFKFYTMKLSFHEKTFTCHVQCLQTLHAQNTEFQWISETLWTAQQNWRTVIEICTILKRWIPTQIAPRQRVLNCPSFQQLKRKISINEFQCKRLNSIFSHRHGQLVISFEKALNGAAHLMRGCRGWSGLGQRISFDFAFNRRPECIA